ncbi:MAG: cell division protein SepF [Clostridiales bacterium]|nr:cell division protein SepF [Clostridiales bacterium]
MAEKFVDKVKFFMGLDNEESEENDTELKEDNLVETETLDFISKETQNMYDSEINKKFDEPKVVSMNNDENKVNVTIIKPEDFNDSANVVNNLKSEKPVIINLESLDIDVARKIFDFCSGALYALNGKIFKISKNIFLLAPENVDISGNLNKSVESDYEME